MASFILYTIEDKATYILASNYSDAAQRLSANLIKIGNFVCFL